MSLENFASPNLRWSLLLADYPGAKHTFKVQKGSAVGVPNTLDGELDHCVCTITFPEDSDRSESAVGYKKVGNPPKDTTPSDYWNILCTKTLGRALKKAGYPDDTVELKATMHWRQRNAEVAAIANSHGLPQVVTNIIKTDDKVLEQAVSSPESVGEDHDEAIEQQELAEVVDIKSKPRAAAKSEQQTEKQAESAPEVSNEPDRLTKVRTELNSMSQEDKEDFREFLKFHEMPARADEWDSKNLDDIEEWLWPVENGEPVE